MIETIKFITSGAAVKRYHTVTTLTQETVGHHSHVVAMFTLLLKPDASRSLLMAALFHDLAEHQTGDIPSPSKREFGIGNKIEILEHELMASVGIIMPKLSDEEARILKLADIMQGLFFCVRESYLGNRLMDEIGERYFKYAVELGLTESEFEILRTTIRAANKSLSVNSNPEEETNHGC